MGENKKRFTKLFRQFFQSSDSVRIMEDIRVKGVDPIKCFTIFALLSNDKTYRGYANTTLKYLADYFFDTVQTKNINTIKQCLRVMKELELINYDFDISEVGRADLIQIVVNNEEYNGNGQYLEVYDEDFDLLVKHKNTLGFRFFLIYCQINNSYYESKAGSEISYSNLAANCHMSTSTVAYELRKAFSLGLYNTPEIEYRYDANLDRPVRKSNVYILDKERVREIANMSSEEVQEIIDSSDIRESQEIKRMTAWLQEGGHGYEKNEIEQVKKEIELLDKDIRYEVDELQNKQMQYGNGSEYEDITLIYSFYKIRAKNIALENGKLHNKVNNKRAEERIS